MTLVRDAQLFCSFAVATLGIVEFCLFLMATYYEEYDKKKYKVFAAVHFLLFYTAILNALGTVLLNVLVQRITQKEWVKTEELDLDHYVELREQFERVKEQLDTLHHKKNNRTLIGDAENSSTTHDNDDDDDTYAEDDFHLGHAILDLMDRIRYPVLKSKYNRLLQQVRFHELRVHFLQSYELPLKFKVSDYLSRSEQGVLLKLIHVSPIAWLLLTGVVNLFYYILGILSYKSRDTELVGKAMTAIFFSGIFLFLIVTWLLANKMKWIFKQIMHNDSLWNVHHGEDVEEKERLAEEQKNLFWAGDPKLVIAAIQFMMFGYAIIISTLIIFWEEIGAGTVNFWYFAVAVAVCFFLFIYESGSVIPRFTLCSSLAHMVDEGRLNETLGAFHLAESKRLDRERMSRFTKKPISVQLDAQSVISEAPSMGSSVAGSKRSKLTQSTAATMLMEMVKSDTASLRVYLPTDTDNSKGRLKQHSDGVSAMSRTTADDITVHNHSMPPPAQPKRNRRKARSDGVSFMAMADRLESIRNESGSPKENDDQDDSSIYSNSSGYSDLNELPDAEPIDAEDEHHKPPSIPLVDRMYNYFLSRRHIVVSNVFGTMIAFFFVGQRVEGFFHSEGIANEKFVHFDFAHEYIFWLLVLWLLCFVLKFFVVMYALGHRPRKLFREQKVMVATYLDLALVIFCLGMLFAAEAQRCCFPDIEDEEILETYGQGAPCSCPAFGSRQYGGLGRIEPWVALISLRVFRHYLADWIVKRFFYQEHNVNPELLRGQSLRLNPFDVFGHSERPDLKPTNDDHDHHDDHDHGDDEHQEHGTAAELWEKTLGKYPELAAKHGEFSCEILRAMLGLSTELPDTMSQGTNNYELQSEKSNVRVPKHTSASKAPSLGAGDSTTKRSKRSNSLTRVPSTLSRSIRVESIFSSPQERLLRSMRRCDRKFLPILDEWSVVDVVMTRFELVYFAAEDVDDGGLDKAGQEALENLQNTKGGRGLRLESVAKGRRVVGHVQLSDITQVHVERSYGSEPEFANVEVKKTEFWKTRPSSPKKEKRGERWLDVAQDVLKLTTRQSQTLYLRFYSDLQEKESIQHAGSADESELQKDNALHWAQTVGRLRGTNLDQPLSHFGEGNDSEVMDYLVIKPHSGSPRAERVAI